MPYVMKIERCICCDHEPDGGDSVYYGMPQLKVCGGGPTTYYEAFCPNCGRGGFFQHKSAYKALKWWNALQEGLRRAEKGFFADGGTSDG